LKIFIGCLKPEKSRQLFPEERKMQQALMQQTEVKGTR
jgi:hypothetical protein